MLLVGLLLGGCAGGSTPSADCTAQVRYDGVVYDGWGQTEAAGGRLGPGELAACHDLGRDPEGSTFTDATSVTLQRLPGVDPAEAVALRQGRLTTLFVADTLSVRRRDQLIERLTP